MRFKGWLAALCLITVACGSSKPPATLPSLDDVVPEAGFAGSEECVAPAPGEPIFITETCSDPRYAEPYLFADTGGLQLDLLPVPHYVVRGGFRGTPVAFAFYFPLPDQYQGRFYQGPVHQLRLTGEVATDLELRHALDSGAYLVEVNPLQDGSLTARDALSGRYDTSLMGYRLAAASAKYSRALAARIYGDHRPYGYTYGGSGGAYMTLSSAEHTLGVWDGFVPFVMGHPLAIPGDFTVRLHALRVLKNRNKWPEVIDALDPGGSGDPYATLDAEEAGALREATLLGFPPRGWYSWAAMTGGPFFLVAAYGPILDPGYADDFWSQAGYLGTDPASSVAAARVQQAATVVAATPAIPPPDYDALGPAYTAYIVSQYLTGPPRFVTLSSLPPGDLENDFHLVIESGPAAGRFVKIGRVIRETNTIGFGGGEDPDVVNLIGIGDRVRVDNSLYLALQTHHRHQVPPQEWGLYGWDQFRNPDGTPKYPQRDILVGPIGAFKASGSVANGRFHGKMILLQNLMDIDAFPWCADWYRTQALQARAAEGQNLDDDFRLWFNDNAQHTDGTDLSRTVIYLGMRQQAMRDVSRWVEEGVPPPASTRYRVVDTQIVVPPTAAERGGIQPVVTLTANGGVRTEVGVGEPVSFRATVEVPPGAGELVQTEWDFEGAGGTQIPDPFMGVGVDPGATVGDVLLPIDPGTISLEETHAYDEPGTYFAFVRVTTQRGRCDDAVRQGAEHRARARRRAVRTGFTDPGTSRRSPPRAPSPH